MGKAEYNIVDSELFCEPLSYGLIISANIEVPTGAANLKMTN